MGTVSNAPSGMWSEGDHRHKGETDQSRDLLVTVAAAHGREEAMRIARAPGLISGLHEAAATRSTRL